MTCRMNGLTGQKMQRIFKALVPESVYNDARSLVEYCCFRFLSRDSSNLHPSLSVSTSFTLKFQTLFNDSMMIRYGVLIYFREKLNLLPLYLERVINFLPKRLYLKLKRGRS